jgi:rare lipoprotein A
MVADGPVVGRKVGHLPGRHAKRRTPKNVRYLVPLVAALLVTGSLLGVSTLTGRIFTGKEAATAEPPTQAPTPSPSSPDPTDRALQHASRGLARAPKPKPSKSPSPSPSKTASPTADDDGGGTVTDSGSCKMSYYETGSTTASGEPFDPDGLTAAHKTLAFDTRVRVTNTANGESVVVRINDRGPFVAGRCMDLSRGAFDAIASLSSGVITAKYEILDS